MSKTVIRLDVDKRLQPVQEALTAQLLDLGYEVQQQSVLKTSRVTRGPLEAFQLVVAAVTLADIGLRFLRRSEWTARDVREAVDAEMLSKGIHNYEIQSVHGFREFRERSESLCKLTVAEPNGSRHVVYVFADGDVAALRVEPEAD